jgi:hypothetical protein
MLCWQQHPTGKIVPLINGTNNTCSNIMANILAEDSSQAGQHANARLKQHQTAAVFVITLL